MEAGIEPGWRGHGLFGHLYTRLGVWHSDTLANCLYYDDTFSIPKNTPSSTAAEGACV